MSDPRHTVYDALQTVKGVPADASPDSSLTKDLGLESIDIVDVFFEIEQATGVVIDINQLLSQSSTRSGRRFEDISIQDLIHFLTERGS